jgi:hypothetical protein
VVELGRGLPSHDESQYNLSISKNETARSEVPGWSAVDSVVHQGG